MTGAAMAKVAAGVPMLWLVADAALDGRISLTALAIYAPATLAVLQLGYMGDANTYLSQASHLAGKAREIEARLAAVGSSLAPVHGRSDAGARDASHLPRECIRFDEVSFRYPGTTHEVLSKLDLSIPVGRSLAIVGENGAGKTTIIKLLCRLYEPTSGSITVDGHSLVDLDLEAWRRRIGVIFQDFVRWELSLAENLRFGARADGPDREVLERALTAAGGEDLLTDSEDRWGIPLSRGFEGGTDLSGGQWQKVALARALAAVHRGAGVLVLDEPTASLDVRAEAAVFERLLAASSGITTILVSHRFNTVRRADQIAVVAGGRVTELGSHAELAERGGSYASMYRLQANRFDGAVSEEIADA